LLLSSGRGENLIGSVPKATTQPRDCLVIGNEPASAVRIKKRLPLAHDLRLPADVTAKDRQQCDADHQRPQAELEAKYHGGILPRRSLNPPQRLPAPKVASIAMMSTKGSRLNPTRLATKTFAAHDKRSSAPTMMRGIETILRHNGTKGGCSVGDLA
jgi:hypothetical protein